MKKLITLLFLLTSLAALAQETDEFAYNSEFTWGFNFNTNGGLLGGFSFKKAMALDKKTYQSFFLELVNVKHPKEIRYPSYTTGNNFIYGKQNYLYAIRAQYGREHILFRKAPEEGVQINFLYAGGLSLGVVSPYYVQYLRDGEIKYVPYDPATTNNKDNIYGAGYIFQGLDESKIKPGLNAKTSLTFEFGAFRNNVVGFETGFMAEVYSQKIIIVPTSTNRAFFTSAFFTLFYGSRR